MRPPVVLALPVLAVVLAACVGVEGAPPPPPSTAPPLTEELPTTTEPAPATTAPTETETSGAGDPVALVPTPVDALLDCRRVRILAPTCPTRVPAAPYDPESPIYDARAVRGIPHPGAWGFTVQWGGEHPGRPELDRPPATVHVVAAVGNGLEAGPARRAEIADGLLERRRRGYLAFGQVSWAGRRGELLLAPPYPLGGIAANHLLFRWRANGLEHEVSLHGWEPFTEVPPVLRAVVESLPGG